jgi:hypothetical protein
VVLEEEWRGNGAQIPHLPGELTRGREIISEVPPRETYSYHKTGTDRGLFELIPRIIVAMSVIHAVGRTITPSSSANPHHAH